ncbi:MAG: type II toxin-antitoxin system RelE/ParE family toxin [Tunicatimonas sp.]
MAQLNWTTQSQTDLNNIGRYIANDSVKYARLQVQKIRNRSRQLVKMPESGRMVPELGRKDVRELIEGNYRIIYRIKSEEQIDIITVHHSARQLNEEKLKQE